VRGNDVTEFVGREVLRHSHEQLVECEISTRVNDRAGVVVNNQELVGLHRLPVFLDKVGEHQAGVIVVAVKFEGHGRPAVQ